MIEGPALIQQMLDETFPGMRLDFNERTGYWVIHDDLFFVDGAVDYTACYPCPGGLVGIEQYPMTRRALIWNLGNPRDFERWEPHGDLILNALYRAHNGARLDAINEFIDQIEAGEDAEEHRERLEKRNRARDVAGEVFDQVVAGRSTFSSEGSTTPWKREQDAKRAEAEKAAETAAADAEADALIRDGKYGFAGMRTIGT